MESSTPLNRDAEGLQAVVQENFPESVPVQPEAASLLREHVPDHGPELATNYYEPESEKHAVIINSDEQDSPPPKYNHDDPPSSRSPRQQRILGMRRKVFIWVAVAVGIVVILAAILGGVLGSVLHKDNSTDDASDNSKSNSSSSTSSTSSTQADDQTHLALANTPGTTDLYTYYIDTDGAIVEVHYPYSAWTQTTHSLSNLTNITTGALDGSPLAAISFNANGTSWRQIFYLDTAGRLTTTSRTATGSWSSPYSLLAQDGTDMIPVTAVAKSNALAAVADTNPVALNGIRIYFGATLSGQSYIQEIGMDFSESSINNPTWHWWHTFGNSDAQSGVASVVVNNTNHVYFRSASTGGLQPFTWNYELATTNYTWTAAPSTSSPNFVSPGSSMAVASDGSNTDYIFYQTSSSQNIATSDSATVRIAHSFATGFTGLDSGISVLQESPAPYSLAALWWPGSVSTDKGQVISEGAVVLTQNSSDTTQLLFSQISTSGQTQVSFTYTGASS